MQIAYSPFATNSTFAPSNRAPPTQKIHTHTPQASRPSFIGTEKANGVGQLPPPSPHPSPYPAFHHHGSNVEPRPTAPSELAIPSRRWLYPYRGVYGHHVDYVRVPEPGTSAERRTRGKRKKERSGCGRREEVPPRRVLKLTFTTNLNLRIWPSECFFSVTGPTPSAASA